MEFTGERLVPGAVDADLETEHRLRYEFARQFARGKRVLDAACGTGYGSAMLAQVASSVCGLDISHDAIAYAKEKYAVDGVQFLEGSVTSLPFENGAFDVVVSFETLEHIDSHSQELFLKEINRVMASDGVLIMSTPNREVYDYRGDNDFHVCEKSCTEFREMLSDCYKNVRLFSQQWETGISITSFGECDADLQSALHPETAEYLIAICSNAVVDKCKSIVSYVEQGKYQKLLSWAVENHAHIQSCNAHIKNLDKEIENYRSVIDSERRELNATRSQINALRQNKDELEVKAGRQAQDILFHKEQLDVLTDRIACLERKLSNKQEYIESLLESDRELQRVKSSRSWRFMGYVWKLRDWLIPKGSKRRLFCKIIVQFIKHPIRFLSKCTPQKVMKFFNTLHREGVEGTSRRLDDCLVGSQIPKQELKIMEVNERNGEIKTASDYEMLNVPQWRQPCVSIVIPVYNQFDYTYACVKSILQNSGDITYEILIADDCSTDLTEQIDGIIAGLHTIRNKENLRFLLNCNNAAKQARGEYILFLNNDTQVQENWLEPLVSLMRKDPSVGMTGSKLVYPDGRLQEAGGILWSDGSAWNYGNRSDPNAPEYNYVKEVDYISGASICIRRELWEEIGGFDERFVPAYCEDSDLAFEVRRRGYKVVYQPFSVVVHFEGISNGTDITTGQKAYQVANQKKFYGKWQQVLEQENYPNGENVFLARDRSRQKRVVVVVDHYIPTYDKDAGSRTVDQYLQLLVELGYNVKFIGDNYGCNIPYARRLEEWGIEILYGVYYRDCWKDWVRQNATNIDFVFLNRPHIAVKYIDYFRRETNAKIIYYGHDLHFLRELREYEISGDIALKESSDKWKRQELGIMSKADVVFTLSVDEQAIINSELGERKAVISPIFYFSQFPNTAVELSEGCEIIFVGGFGHRPNEDGIVWFVETMWARICHAIPDAHLTIIGSNPTAKVKSLESTQIHVTGYVTDEQLEQYYKKARLCIIPLRFGAGVKGKTIEAMYHKVPIVSTSTGTEGLPGIEQYLPATDDEEAFTQRAICLCQSEEASRIEAGGYYDYLKRYFSRERAEKLFREVFNEEND